MKKRNAYKILVGKPEGKPLGRWINGWMDGWIHQTTHPSTKAIKPNYSKQRVVDEKHKHMNLVIHTVLLQLHFKQ
jgi:hypothetical protein